MSDASQRQSSSSSPEESVTRSAARRPWFRRSLPVFGWAVLITLAIALPLLIRAGWEGRAELQHAQQAARAGDVEREIEHLGRAARWRVPGMQHQEVALERLVAIGEEREAAGPETLEASLAAYREVRRALLATRTWTVSHPELLADVNRRIARLMARQEAEIGSDISGTGDPYAHHLALLETVPGPNPLRANLAAFAFVGWLFSSALFVLRALDAKGRLRPRPALRWGGTSLLLLMAWMLLLRFA